jgi:NDP-sugar pyrophosphorylase family protein
MTRVVIMAGGRGTRLRPYTVSLPKPLVPVGDTPILEIIIKQLVANGFDHVTLAVNHQADIIRAFFGDGSKWGIRLDYSLEKIPLSTMGPLTLIDDLPDNFMVMNGDVLTDLPYRDLFRTHCDNNSLFTVAATGRKQLVDYGVLDVDTSGRLTGFHEKPNNIYVVSMGVYCLNRRILNRIPVGKPFGFDDLVTAMLASGEPVAVHRYGGFWLDIGRPDDYESAVEMWPKLQPTFFPSDPA